MVSDAVKKEFWGWFRLVNLWLIVFPTKCALFALIFAGPIALIEDAKFSDGFLYLLQVLTGASIPLTNWALPGAGPKEVWGLIIANAMGIVKQLILSLHIGLTAGPMIEGWLDWDVGIWGCCVSGKLLVGRTQFFKKYVQRRGLTGTESQRVFISMSRSFSSSTSRSSASSSRSPPAASLRRPRAGPIGTASSWFSVR